MQKYIIFVFRTKKGTFSFALYSLNRTFAPVKYRLLLILWLLSLICYAQEREGHFDTATMNAPVYEADTTALPNGVMRPVYWLGRYLKNTNKHADRPFDCSFLCGPSYSATTSLGVGGGLSGLYSWDRSDPYLTKSSISLFFNTSIKGIIQTGFKGNNFMKGDRQRWNYKLTFQSIPTDFWGIGYENGAVDANKGSYHMIKVNFKPEYLFRLREFMYLGPQLHILYNHTYDFSDVSMISGMDHNFFSNGIGFIAQYDSRDFPLNAYRGNFVKVEQMFYPKLTNEHYFNYTDLTYAAYRNMWKGGIVAMELHSRFNYGNVPWTMLCLVGEDGRMRGYYEGRYRDRNIIEGQLEIRQSFSHRQGAVIWVGAANVFPDFRHIYMRQVLPNYGIGWRWEFKQRVNFRFDLGFTKDKPGFCVNMNEAF